MLLGEVVEKSGGHAFVSLLLGHLAEIIPSDSFRYKEEIVFAEKRIAITQSVFPAYGFKGDLQSCHNSTSLT
jgi:hypothetical protein